MHVAGPGDHGEETKRRAFAMMLSRTGRDRDPPLGRGQTREGRRAPRGCAAGAPYRGTASPPPPPPPPVASNYRASVEQIGPNHAITSGCEMSSSHACVCVVHTQPWHAVRPRGYDQPNAIGKPQGTPCVLVTSSPTDVRAGQHQHCSTAERRLASNNVSVFVWIGLTRCLEAFAPWPCPAVLRIIHTGPSLCLFVTSYVSVCVCVCFVSECLFFFFGKAPGLMTTSSF